MAAAGIIPGRGFFDAAGSYFVFVIKAFPLSSIIRVVGERDRNKKALAG
jgi:hypothetical protein